MRSADETGCSFTPIFRWLTWSTNRSPPCTRATSRSRRCFRRSQRCIATESSPTPNTRRSVSDSPGLRPDERLHDVGLHASAAIINRTMGDMSPRYPGPRLPASEKPRRSMKVVAEEPPVTPEQQRSIAHARGRICKLRGCEVCAPLRESRRMKKAARKTEARAQLHAKGEPCGRASCLVATCVESRHSKTANPAAAVVQRADERNDDPGESLRRQAERHRAGLPCGSESCPNQVCVEGFAQERARRHRARRPCRSTRCDNPICVSSRLST